MNSNDRMTDFIDYLSWKLPDYLYEVYDQAVDNKVPVIRKSTQSLLKTILYMKKPVSVLEIGTAIGFSSMLISEYVGEETKITTIEMIEKRIEEAKANFIKYKKKDRIELLEGDAGVILEKLSEEEIKFDFIFLDAAQAQYSSYLKNILKLMEKDAILISDNILCNSDIIESRFTVNRRDRTVHKRMREYLYEITHNPYLSSTILPIGDGLCLSVKI
jgi:predicted O-methyltransferase YrrM